MRALRVLTAAVVLLVPSYLPVEAADDPSVVMAEAAGHFLAALTPEQRARVMHPFGDEARFDFHYVPPEIHPRPGLPLKDMNAAQQHLAQAFISTGLSQRGYVKVTTIMSLEEILRALSPGGRVARDAAEYYVAVFGEPGPDATWGWNLQGHHLAINYTVVNGSMVTSVPTFFGTNPAEVREGPRKGLRVLAKEEDLAFTLLASLDETQRARAIIAEEAPDDIFSGNQPRVDPEAPAGLPVEDMTDAQTLMVIALLSEYAGAMPDALADARMAKVRQAGLGNVMFAWMGSRERGAGHYYRLQGPTFVVEYDNIQNNANHVHSAWRDFDGDFGADLLAEHYRAEPHN